LFTACPICKARINRREILKTGFKSNFATIGKCFGVCTSVKRNVAHQKAEETCEAFALEMGFRRVMDIIKNYSSPVNGFFFFADSHFISFSRTAAQKIDNSQLLDFTM
jgi:hypothetical protein